MDNQLKPWSSIDYRKQIDEIKDLIRIIDDAKLNAIENGYNMACVDMETGEIDFHKASQYLNGLEIERKTKLENIALYIKNLERW